MGEVHATCQDEISGELVNDLDWFDVCDELEGDLDLEDYLEEIIGAGEQLGEAEFWRKVNKENNNLLGF